MAAVWLARVLHGSVSDTGGEGVSFGGGAAIGSKLCMIPAAGIFCWYDWALLSYVCWPVVNGWACVLPG